MLLPDVMTISKFVSAHLHLKGPPNAAFKSPAFPCYPPSVAHFIRAARESHRALVCNNIYLLTVRFTVTSYNMSSLSLIQHRVGGWLPRNHSVLETWLDKRVIQCDAEPVPFLPVIRDFQQLIEGDAEIFMGFHQMFDQVPSKPPYNADPTGKPQVRDYDYTPHINLRHLVILTSLGSRLHVHVKNVQPNHHRSARL